MPDHPQVDYAACTPDQREAALDGLAARSAALHAEMLRAIAAAESAEDHRSDGAITMADWLAYRYNLSPRTARQWVRAARALTDMPRLCQAYAAGRISFEALSHALSFARPEEDAWLAELLPGLSCSDIEVMAKQRRRIRDEEHADARRTAHLRIRPDRSGLGSRISGFLPTEDAAHVQAALDRRAESAGPDPETGTWAPLDHRHAHALRDICAEDLARSAAGSGDPDTTVVVVHAPAALLRPDLTPGERAAIPNATIATYPIPDSALHRLLCDTRIELNIDTADGRTIGVGRAARNPPAWLRRRVIARDHGRCRWPGCHRPIRHVHHMTHWTRGGATDASNLLGICWHHHHELHEGGWDATGDADHEVVITSRFGRTLHSRAGPAAA